MKANKQYLLRVFMISAMIMQAVFPAFAGNDSCAGCRVISDQELDEFRGGYSAADGLEVTFGIEKSILVNGVLQVVNTLNIPLTGTALGQVTANTQGSTLNLLQSGVGSTISPSVLAGLQTGVFNFIQNTLDNAVIQNNTQITASVTVLNLYRNMNLTSMMNQQMINSLR